MNDRTKAALIGGGVAGVLSIIPLVQYCCILWAIGGGVLAVFMYMKSAGGTMTPGDGSKLGMRAGIIAAVIFLLVMSLMVLVMGSAAISDAMQRAGGDQAIGAGVGIAVVIVTVFVMAIVVFGFTTLGGLLGAAIFGKGTSAAPPPPPPGGGFGGPAGGGFGGPPQGGGYGDQQQGGGGGYGGPSGGSFGQG